jgi:Tol biopolymer transport system component
LRGVTDNVGHVVGDSVLFYNEKKRQSEGKLYVSPNMIYGSYAPATKKYIYTSQAVGFMPEIWIANADASEKKRLKIQGYKGDISKDGNYIAYTDTRRINGRLWIMDADGNNQRQITFYEQFK